MKRQAGSPGGRASLAETVICSGPVSSSSRTKHCNTCSSVFTGHHTFRSGAEAAPHMRYLVERVTDPDAVCICRYCPRQPADKSTANSTAASATRDETRALALHTDLTAAPPYDLVRAFLHRRGEVVEAAGKMGFVVGSTRHRGTRTYEIRRFGGGSVQVDAARVIPAITALQQRTDKDSPDIRAAERISSLCSIQ